MARRRRTSDEERVDQLIAAARGEHELDGVAGTWVRDCWYASIVTANRRKRKNRRWHLVCRYLAYTGALVLPILAGITTVAEESAVRWYTFAVSLVVAFATGALQVFKFGQQWRIHEEFASAMEVEGWSYFQRLGPYGQTTSDEDAYALFFDRVERMRFQRGRQFIDEIGADVVNLEGGAGAARE